MSPGDLLEALDVVAGSEDGIETLRGLVIELATAGKLVPQDSADEPATKLVSRGLTFAREYETPARKRAREENWKDPQSPLPEGWAWACCALLGDTSPRNKAEDDLEVAFAPMPVIPTDYRSAMQPETKSWGEIKKGYTHFADGDIAVAKITPCFQNGKASVFRDLPNGIGAGTTELHVLRPYDGLVDPTYMLLLFRSPSFVAGGVATFTGTAGQQRVAAEYFRYRPFPLPPLAEQRRIVAKVDELMALLDELERTRDERDERRAAFRDSALAALQNAEDAEAVHAAWPRIAANLADCITDPADIAPLRQTILQLAVRGRLVPQDPEDEPASELLKRTEMVRVSRWVDAELQKRGNAGKGRSQIEAKYPDISRAPLLPTAIALPDSWEWASVESLTDPVRTVSYGILKPGPHQPNGVPVVKVKNIQNGKVQTRELRRTTREIHSKFKRSELVAGDVLVSIRGTVGKVAITPEEVAGGNVTQDTARLAVIDPGLVPFVVLALRSALLQDHFQVHRKGAAVQGLNIGDLRPSPVPIPPLAEQRRIVAKVDELMAICDELEQQLTEAKAHQSAFAAAAVHHLDIAGDESDTNKKIAVSRFVKIEAGA